MPLLALLLAALLAPASQLLPPAERLVPVAARDVHLAADSFWGPRLQTNALVSLQHGAAMLEQHGQFGNFRLAAATLGHALPTGSVPPAAYSGVHFYDSDAYKWLEACCLALEQDPPAGADPAAATAARTDLRARVDRFVEEIPAAQRDGYLQTQYVVKGQEPWSNLHDDHELYCAGHLIQAAIAHHRLTGERRLLDVALRFADLIDRTFGPAGERRGACGHPEIETALVQLSDHTGERRWLELARTFLEARGQGLLRGDESLQDHAAIREQRAATGHAVRQLYLSSGVLGVGARTGDADLIDANLAVWDDIVRGKLYVTGGLGARPDGEAFGAPFELPNDRAYSETCASIAWMRWNHELLSATGDGRYADALETTLHNAFLAAVGQDGRSWFYVNPLESRGGHARQPWFWCACCPPNVMRTLAGLPGWFASTTEDTLWLHLFDDAEIDATLGNGRRVRVAVETGWPEAGNVRLRLRGADSEPLAIAVRIPAWAEDVRTLQPGLSHLDAFGWKGGQRGQCTRYVTGELRASLDGVEPPEALEWTVAFAPRWLAADPRVAADVGQRALLRGPVVYAYQGEDQTGDLGELSVDTHEPVRVWRDQAGGGLRLDVAGIHRPRLAQDALYASESPYARGARLVARPYAEWAQGGPAAMRVWMPSVARVPSVSDDIAFLEQAADALVLRAAGGPPVVVSPRLSGRVMTSAFADDEPGFGLVNRSAIRQGPVERGFANYGGEDRLWLAPEGGPRALFFAPGAEQVPEAWSVPAAMDGRPRPVVARNAASVTFRDVVDFANAAGQHGSVRLERQVEALDRPAVEALLGRPLPDTVRLVAFRSRNTLAWADAPPEGALVGLWVLGQYAPSDRTTVLFPFHAGAAGDASPADITAAAIKRDYFGVVPDDRLQLLLPGGPQAFGLARFRADSRLRSKIGLAAAHATGWIGAFDEDRGVLTLVSHTLPPPGAPVPDCDWRVPNPRAALGDVATSYNHGDEPRFFELESLSAALASQPGASVEHVHTTLHLGGDREALAGIARAVLHAEL